MTIKFEAGEGMDKITDENGVLFDRYFSTVTDDTFDRYSNFIYLVVKRVDDSHSGLVTRNAYLVPFTCLDQFLKSVNLPGEKFVHIEPLTMEMLSFTREELRKDHISAPD